MTRKLHVVALGGTIASARPQHSDSAAGGPPAAAEGVVPVISGEEIAQSAGLDTLYSGAGVAVTFDQVAQVGGPNVTVQAVSDVVASCKQAKETHGAQAAIVTQGTDSLEETAFALSQLNNSGIPIVATGAMRHPSLPGADGPANVRAAALTAFAMSDGIGLKAALVMNDEIHDPWFVRKAHATSPAAFTSGPLLGALGWVTEGRAYFAHRPAPRETPPWQDAIAIPGSVPIVEVGSGDSLEMVDHLPTANTVGVVISGLGGGHVPAVAARRVYALATRIPTVIASRAGAGAVLQHTYAWPGGDIDLREHGLIPAGVLDSRKARIVLLLCQAAHIDAASVFARYFQAPLPV